jgi:hypothetical protein
MITIFTTGKAFKGIYATTQRNTLACWKALAPDADVMLIGEEEGAREAATETGARFFPTVERNAYGTPLLPSVFSIAEKEARFDLMVYANADILFTPRLVKCMRLLGERKRPFLMIGRRRDMDINARLDFSMTGWDGQLEQTAEEKGKPGLKSALDYFGFLRGEFFRTHGPLKFPNLAIGRWGWDDYMVFWAKVQGLEVVDGSDAILAAHQNHDYSYGGSAEAIQNGPEGRANFAMTSTSRYLYTPVDASYRFTRDGKLKRALGRHNIRRAIVTWPDVLLARWFGYQAKDR